MKCNSLISVLTGIIFIASSLSCSNNYNVNPSNKLPPITMEGKNTFGCKMNGEVWLPYKSLGDISTGSVLNFSYNKSNQKFHLTAIHAEKKYKELLQINIQLVKEGIYKNYVDSWRSDDVFYSDNDGELKYYIVDSTAIDNQIKITKFDSINHIISGEFYFTLYEINYKDTIIVSDGRFDLKLE
ncbi:MAG: DUF6252 family protein [Bacteroidota bacterium]|nr:DUF6252 family protein [Bacteroidota bacterium]